MSYTIHEESLGNEAASGLGRPVRRVRRRGAFVLGIALSVAFVASCGSSDDGVSSEEAFCDASDSLQTNMTSLVNLDLISGGTDALNEQLDAIRSNLDTLKESGQDVAGDEIDALVASFDELTDAADALGAEITVDNTTVTVTAIARVGTAASAVYETLSTTCP